MIDLIGATLGSFIIEASIGSNATGQLYRARHLHLGRPAALKVLDRRVTTIPGFPQRFQDAMRRAAALRHPNIVEIYDLGVQDDYAFLVQELVDTGALNALIQRNASNHMPFPIALAVDLACQAADGLGYAHAQGDTHGAIAPETLLLQRQGNGSANGRSYRLKIADFGMAQLLPAATLGPPAYLSPEQFQEHRPDARSDFYSLGVVLYELIAGAPPFAAATFEEAAEQHLNTPPPPPRQSRPDLPATLEAIVLRCLAKSPEQRFGTAGELAAALRQVSSSPPALAAAEGTRAATTSAPKSIIAVAGAPAIQSAPVPSPQIQVLDAQGRVLQSVSLTKAGLTVGRAPENDVCLDDPVIARNQLLIAWRDPQVLATNLGSSTATFLGSQRLDPFVQQAWDGRAVLSVGPFRLKLLKSAPDSPTLQGQHDTAPATGPATASSGVERIGVRLDPEQLRLTPGEPAVVRVTMINQGNVIDSLSIAVAGIPSAWVRGTEQTAQLSPGAEATIPLTIEVPRAPESLPHDYQVRVQARSATNLDKSSTASALWSVLPYSACDLRITPNKASDRTVAEYQVTVCNTGNTSANYALSAIDNDQVLKYIFAQDQALLKPGQLVTVPLTVHAPRLLFGSDQPRAFTVQAEIPNGPSESATAQFIQRALVPIWLPLVLALLLLFAVMINRVLPSISTSAPPATVAVAPTTPPTAAPSPTAAPGAPVVNLFIIQPQFVAPGQPVLVSWDVQGAERVTISQFGDVPPNGQREHRPEQTTDYRLVAVGGGTSTTRVERVNVVAPTTVIEPSVVPSPVPIETPAPPPEPTAPARPTPALPPEPTTPARPTPAPPPPAPVNLLDLAPSARWQSDNQTVRFGQPPGDPERGGWADFASKVTLEDGQPYASALYTVPTTNTAGYIEGEFTIPQIRAGQFFLTDIGFGPDARTAGVTVSVKFSGEIIWQGTKQPNGSLIPIDVDLAHLAGRAGQLTLRVDGSGGTARDGIYWIRPRIDVPSQP